MAMDPIEMCQQTTDGAAALMNGLKPDDLARPTPCEGWDVRALINHMIGVNARFAAAVSGEGTPPDASADLVGNDAAASYRAAAQKTIAAFRAPGALDKTVRLAAGEMPGQAACGVFFVDQIQHAWDLARALGRPYTLDPALATTALEMSRQRIGPDRRGPGKPFGEEVPCSDDAPVGDRLAAFLGRQP
jgi:uncharacterized protein (TIGR03086 family)